MSNVIMKPLVPLNSKALRPDAVGLDLVRHQHEPVVPGRAPVAQVLDDDRARRSCPGSASAPPRPILPPSSSACASSFVNSHLSIDALGGRERLPLHREEVAAGSPRCLRAAPGVRDLSNVSTAQSISPCREVAAEVARDPELRAVELGRAVVALVDLVGVVDLAEVLAPPWPPWPACAPWPAGFGVEVALAEHRAAARLDDRRVHGPVGRRLRRLQSGRPRRRQHGRGRHHCVSHDCTPSEAPVGASVRHPGDPAAVRGPTRPAISARRLASASRASAMPSGGFQPNPT